MFVPAVLEEAAVPAPVLSLPAPVSGSPRARRPCRARHGAGAAPIEVSMEGISVRIGRDADATLNGAVLNTLKGTR